ncbi:MAG: cell division protein FtsI/penicillin-binding protein 2 [Myxococcota bacterium]
MIKQEVVFKPLWPFAILALFYSFSVFNFFKLVDEGVDDTSLSLVRGKRVIPAERGQILDRQGLVLAEDRGTWDLVVNYLPKDRSVISNLKNGIWDVEEIRRRLEIVSQATQLTVDELYESLMINESAGQLVLSNLSPIERERISRSLKALPYSGLSLVQTFKRIYPNGPVLSHLTGLLRTEYNEEAGRDERHGSSGLEVGFEEHLFGTDGASYAIRVGSDHGANPALAKMNQLPGSSIRTTLDLGISGYAHEQLRSIMDEHDPMHCVAIVLDVNTGAILSAQGLPDYNPNQPLESMQSVVDAETGKSEYLGWTFPGRWRISPGSTLKPLVAAWALENNAIQPQQIFSNKGGAYRLPGRVIHNSSNSHNEDMNFSAAVVHSSNIVMSQIGRELGREKMAEFLPHFGYDAKADALPGSGLIFQNGVYPKRESFMRKKGPDGMVFTIPSLSFGREIEVPVIDHAIALASIANGGKLMRPNLNYNQLPEVVAEVLSANSAKLVRDAMHEMVMYSNRKWLPHRDDFNYCGKSGTSEHRAGPAKGKYTSLFVAYGPLEKPDVLVLVVAFGTHGTKQHYYGSQVCGPAAANILHYALESRGTLPSSGLESGESKANLEH